MLVQVAQVTASCGGLSADMHSITGLRTMGLRPPRSLAGLAVVATLAAVMLLANGCAVASVGLSVASAVGSTAFGEYRSGEYVAAVEASRPLCERALLGSCKHFGLAVYGWQADYGITTAKLGDDRGGSFTVRIAYVGPERTALYIRAGLWGDDLCSRQLAYDVEEGALRLRTAARAIQAAQAPPAARAPRVIQAPLAIRAAHVIQAPSAVHRAQATRTPQVTRMPQVGTAPRRLPPQ